MTDEALLADLRRVCATADPVPADVLAAAKAPHRYRPGEGIRCGACEATAGYIETGRRWTCAMCGTTGPVADYDLIPGMQGDTHVLD